MRKEDLKDWTTDRLKDEIVNLSKKNFNLECRIKQFKENEGRWECKNKELKDENINLKYHIEDLQEERRKLEKERDELIDERNNLLKNSKAYDFAKLQDQHQQDCIKINQLHVTIDTLVDKYSRLRKTVGMD